jgi:long-chain fatty acid transport protein
MTSITLSIVLSLSQTAFAAGFGLYEASPKGNALGSPIAGVTDASAVFWNPAAITNVDRPQLMFGFSAVAPGAYNLESQSALDAPGDIRFDEAEDNVFQVPYIYFSSKLGSSPLWIGLGIYSRFGLGTEYDDDWDGRYNSTEATITTVEVAANLAWKVSPFVALSVGVRSMYFRAELSNVTDAGRFLGQTPNNPRTSIFDVGTELDGDDSGLGYSLAAEFTAGPIDLAVHYLSEIEVEVEGTAEFIRPAAPIPAIWFNDTNVFADPLSVPAETMLGVSWTFSPKVKWYLGAIYTEWSSIERLAFDFETPIVVIPQLPLVVDRSERDLSWDDSWRLSLGLEWTTNEWLQVLFGIVSDDAAVPDNTVSFLLPENDRSFANFGLIIGFGKWSFDVSLGYLVQEDRTIDPTLAESPFNRQFVDGVLATTVTDQDTIILGAGFTKTW